MKNISDATVKHWPKAIWGVKGLLGLYNPSLRKVKAGNQTWQELKQSPQRGAAYWLPPDDLLSLLSYATQDHLSSDGTTNSGLVSPILIIKQQDAPTDLPTGQSGGGSSSIEVASSPVTPIGVELMKTIHLTFSNIAFFTSNPSADF